MQVKWVVSVVLVMTLSAAAYAERVLLKTDTFQATVPNGGAWCSEQVSVTVRGSRAADFSNTADLQRLLGGIRAALGFECSMAKEVQLIGKVGARTVFQGRAEAGNGWQLTTATSSSNTAAASNPKPQPRAATQTPKSPPVVAPTMPSSNQTQSESSPRSIAASDPAEAPELTFEEMVSEPADERFDVVGLLLYLLGAMVVGVVVFVVWWLRRPKQSKLKSEKLAEESQHQESAPVAAQQRSMPPPEDAITDIDAIEEPRLGAAREELLALQRQKYQDSVNRALDELTQLQMQFQQHTGVPPLVQDELKILAKALKTELRGAVRSEVTSWSHVLLSVVFLLPYFRLFRIWPIGLKLIMLAVFGSGAYYLYELTLSQGGYAHWAVAYVGLALVAAVIQWRSTARFLNQVMEEAGGFKALRLNYVYMNQSEGEGARYVWCSTLPDEVLPGETQLTANDLAIGMVPGQASLFLGNFAVYEVDDDAADHLLGDDKENEFMREHGQALTRAMAGHADVICELRRRLQGYGDLHWRIKLLEHDIPRLEELLENLNRLEDIWADVYTDPKVFDFLLRRIDLFNLRDRAAPPGVLLYGYPGNGKEFLAHKIAESVFASYEKVSAAELNSVEDVKALWEHHRSGGPSVLFVDEAEHIFPVADANTQGASRETILAWLEAWSLQDAAHSSVWVVLSASSDKAIDQRILSLLGSSKIEIRPPDGEGREMLLKQACVANQIQPTLPDSLIQNTAGSSIRELREMVKDAKLHALPHQPNEQHWRDAINHVRGTDAALLDASKTWDRIVLPEDVKEQLQRAARVLREADRYKERGVKVPNVLLYGPPGTGKTDIARTFANEGGVKFMTASTADLKAQYTGQSAHLVREVFNKARASAPCVLFIDEIETVAGKRGSENADSFTQEIVTQLLQEMEGAAHNERDVFVLAATNMPETVDDAVLSRFTSKIEIPLPDAAARQEILHKLLLERHVAEDVDLDELTAKLAKQTNRKSGRDLVMLVNRAMERAVMHSDTPEDVVLTEQILLEEASPQGKAVSDTELEAIWSKIVLAPEIQDSIVSKIKLFNAADKAAPRGLLLYGPPGTGKTEIARRIADSASCYFMSLSGPDLKAGYAGQSGQKVRQIWDQARARGRCVIFIDECEGVFARRGSTGADALTDELVQAFLAEWDGVASEGMIWVVGATNRRDLLDDAIVSRFGAAVEIGLPGAAERERIIQLEVEKLERDWVLPDSLGQATQGFSGRNLSVLARDVASRCAEAGLLPDEAMWQQAIDNLRGGSSGKDSSKTWDRLVLPPTIKQQLQRAVKLVRDAESYKEAGVGVPNILLYGPPGTGKTDIARTFANEGGVAFIAASTADLKAGYTGQSGQKVKELFERARGQSPCILFIDEIETVARSRNSASADAFTNEIVTQMLAEMDGATATERQVFVLAATNLPEEVDAAVLSRFSNKIEIPLPDASGRKELLQRLFAERRLQQGFDVPALAAELSSSTDGFSGRDLVMLVNRAMERSVAQAESAADVTLTAEALRAELAPEQDAVTDEQIEQIWSKIVLAPEVQESIVSRVKMFNSGDKAAPKGILLYGPPGTGKTEIARRIAESSSCEFLALSSPDLKAGHVGQSGQKVRDVWNKARSRGRCIMFIDECEGVFARRGSSSADSFTDEIVQAFLAEWDGMEDAGQVWVVGATNRRDLVDDAIISRFGAAVEVQLPAAPERMRILALELAKLERQAELPEFLAQATTGFSGRNLKMLAVDAVTLAAERGSSLDEGIWRDAAGRMAESGSDAVAADASWDTLILADAIKARLQTVCASLQNIETLAAQGIDPPRGALLYGPPGTGKTQIARTMAAESGLTFLSATTADLKAGYVGQSGQKAKELFERARGVAPCILFIDEIEAVAPERNGPGADQFTNEIVTQLLQELDGVKKTERHVFVLAATNLPDSIDAAIRSRFEEEIEIPNPDLAQRQAIFAMFLGKQSIVTFDIDAASAQAAELAGDVGGRDIRAMIQRATQTALTRALHNGTADQVAMQMEDLLSAVKDEVA